MFLSPPLSGNRKRGWHIGRVLCEVTTRNKPHISIINALNNVKISRKFVTSTLFTFISKFLEFS